MRRRGMAAVGMACAVALVLSACGSDDEDSGDGGGGGGGGGGGFFFAVAGATTIEPTTAAERPSPETNDRLRTFILRSFP